MTADRPRWRRLRGTWSKRVPRTDAFLASHRQRLLVRMHPLLRPLVRAAIAEEIPLSEVEERGGVGGETIRKWFGSDPNRKTPALVSLEAALGVFGMALAVVPADWLPDDDDRDLTTVEALRRMVRRAQETEREGEEPAADAPSCSRCAAAPAVPGDSMCRPCRAEYMREWRGNRPAK